MLLPLISGSAVVRILRRFRRNRRGSTAVEFALIAPLFFALLFAIIETAMVFFASQVLETAAQDSARLIMTGQAQSGAMSKSLFKDSVCSRLSNLFDCANGITVDVQCYPSFSNVVIADPIVNKTFVDNTQWRPGGPSDVVVVRVFYQWPLFITGLGYNISNLNGSKRLLSATSAFRNEPFTSGSC